MDALQAKVNRELIKYAVMREIFCQFSGVVLDMRRAVLVSTYQDDKPAGSFVCTAERWDERKDAIYAGIADGKEAGKIPDSFRIEVLDGRDYYTASGRPRAASSIAA